MLSIIVQAMAESRLCGVSVTKLPFTFVIYRRFSIHCTQYGLHWTKHPHSSLARPCLEYLQIFGAMDA